MTAANLQGPAAFKLVHAVPHGDTYTEGFYEYSNHIKWEHVFTNKLAEATGAKDAPPTTEAEKDAPTTEAAGAGDALPTHGQKALAAAYMVLSEWNREGCYTQRKLCSNYVFF